MLVDTDQVLIFDPNTRTLYSMNELPMFRNGLNLQVNLPTLAELQSQMGPGSDLPTFVGAPAAPEPGKKKRKKTARDRAMKKAVKEANERLRTKPTKQYPKGRLRKGKTQADVMRLANKIADRMMK